MNLDTIKNELHEANRAAFAGAISSAVSAGEFARRLARSDELAEQVRILEAITAAAHEEYMLETLGAAEQERQALEAASIDEWLEPQTVEAATDAAYGTLDLGAHFIIRGGEVMELVDSTSANDEFPF